MAIVKSIATVVGVDNDQVSITSSVKKQSSSIVVEVTFQVSEDEAISVSEIETELASTSVSSGN
jgi:hypothetical protein